MPEAAQENVYFKCPECSVDLLWNPRIAGHKVSCPCGHVFVAPTRSAIRESEAPPPLPQRTPPRRDAEMAAMYMRPRKRVVDDEEEKSGVVRNIVVPSLLTFFGIVIALTQVTWGQPQLGDRRLQLNFLQVFVIELGMIVTTVAAVGGLSFFMNFELGELKIAAFKVISVPIFAGALGLAGGRLDQYPPYVTGMSIGCSLMIIVYWLAFAYFFKLELWEVLLICFVITIVQAVAMFGLFSAIEKPASRGTVPLPKIYPDSGS
jgi:hypothetical protein